MSDEKTLPLRERIGRKAKDRAVETLHELTTNTRATPSKSNESITGGGKNAKSASKKNNRSYRPFAEQTIPSDDEQASELVDETPRKARNRKNVTNTGSRLSRTNKNNATSRLATVPVPAVMTEDQLADSTTNSLFTQLYQGQVATQTLVDDFVELYKKDKDTAMLDLIKLIVRCSGCKSGHLLTRELIRTKEFTEAINDLIDNFSNEDEEGAGAPTEIYLLVQNTAQAKRFNRNFCEFLTLLIGQCQHSIIYDQFMLDVLISFLIALADSQVRAFRHTATLAVLKVMTALVDILLSLSVSKDACQRQYDNERQKSSAKRASDRIEMLLAKRKEIEENELEIQNFINFIFKAVFIHRYRDVCSEIRCICMNEIGEWMAKCPDKFLDDTFLKYIGWTLYDKAGECRLKCLQALQPLYDSEELQGRLELFTSRFKNRLVEMSLDKEIDVAVSAIKLLTVVVMQNDAALEDRDCENLYELVFHTNRSMAQAAGEFLNQKLFNKMDTTVSGKRGKKVNQNASMLQLLVQFLIECELHDHPTYLVDAIWDLHPMLKDWKCMTDLLLDDSDETMNDLNERYLIEVVTCCVRQAATGEIPVARRPQTQKKFNAKELKQIQDDRVALTQHFMTVLPQLLTKFIADAEKLTNLLEIPLHFDLAQYTLRRQEKSLDSLLKLIEDIVFKHNENDVLEAASVCLAYMCDEENSNTIHTRCDVIRSAILDKLVDQYQKAMETVEKMDEVDDNEMFPLITAVRRLSAFARHHDINQYDLLKNTLIILKWVDDNEGFNSDFISKSISLARHLIFWKKYKIWNELRDAKEANQEIVLNKEELEYVSKVSKKFVKHCTKLLVNDNPHIEEEAFFELCDMYTLFDHRDVHDELIALHLEPTNNDVLMLNMFMSDHVFCQEALDEKPDTSENIEKLHKRRTILASFSKLIINGIIQVKYAAEVFRGYAKYASSYGDIIKQLLSACREISKGATAKSIVLAMQQEFLHGFVEKGAEYRNSSEYTAMKELVHKLTLSFGPEASTKSRDAIVTIHQDSIEFVDQAGPEPNKQSRAPPNLMFLELIVEFSSRLTPQDKKHMINDLDRRFAKRANKIEGNNWQPYYTYRLSLMEEQAKSAAIAAANATSNVSSASVNVTTNGTSKHPAASKRRHNDQSENDSVSSVQNGVNNKSRNSNTSRAAGKQNHRKTLTNQVIEEEEEEIENYEDEEVENIHKNGDVETNDASEITMNGIESINLNYTSIKHTRLSKKIMTNGVDRVQEEAASMSKSSPNKRSRSPLVTNNNNSIDDSMSDGPANRVLTSTRIEPPSRSTKSLGRITRSGIGLIAGQRGVNFSEIESSNASLGLDDTDDMTLADASPAKRKRKSEDHENKVVSRRY